MTLDVSFEDLQRVNKEIKTTPIKGKQYAEVPQRIKAFRMLYPQGFIVTDLVSNEDGVCVVRASVGYYNYENPITLGTGTAYEKEGSTFINQSSYIENCETSAVGRALGMAGFGIDVSVASAEEVQNAMLNQSERPDERTISALKARLEKYDFNIDAVCKMYGVDKLEDLDFPAISKLNTQINNTLSKRGIKE